MANEPMKRIFVCSPFRSYTVDGVVISQDENIAFARGYCYYVIGRGAAPFAPHLMYPQFLDDSRGNERCAGIASGLAFLKTCDEMWIFGSTLTEGMIEEIRFCMEHGIPFKYSRHS
jgi:hypothetical protein